MYSTVVLDLERLQVGQVRHRIGQPLDVVAAQIEVPEIRQFPASK